MPFFRATARLPGRARAPSRPFSAVASSQAGRHQFYTVRLHGDVALPAFKGSGDITSLSQVDGYIEIPSDQHVVEEGSMVNVTLF